MADSQNEAKSVADRTVVGAGWMIAWRFVTRGLGFVSTLILVRVLIPADFGIVAVASSFAAGVEALSELGLQAALVRQAVNDRSHYDTAFTLQIIRGVITGTILAAGAWNAGRFFDDTRLSPVLLILAGVAAIGGLDNIGVVQFQRELRFDMEFRLLFLPRVLQFIASTIAAITLQSYWALIIGIVVGRLSRTLTTYLVQPRRARLTLCGWRDLASFSLWSWASSLANMVWNRCDAFVLGPALGMEQLGIFVLSMEIGLLPTTELIEPTTRALYAGVAAAQNRGTNTVTLVLPLISALQMVVAPIGLGLSATSNYVVAGLLGPTWSAGQAVIAILAMLGIITPITYICTTVLNAAGHVRQNFLAVAGAAMLRVSAVYAVARYRRLDWAALAIFGVVAAEALIFLFQLSRHGHLRWREEASGFVRTFTSCAIVAILLWSSGVGWQDVGLPSMQALMTGAAIGASCVTGCLSIQMTLWLLTGRPRGPETILLNLLGNFRPRRKAGLA